MFNFFKKDKQEKELATAPEVNSKNKNQTPTDAINEEELSRRFMELYAPYLLKDYVIKERVYEESSNLDEDERKRIILAKQVDLIRTEDPFVGAKVAGQEILSNTMSWLKDERGIHSETLLAVLASIGGRVCVQGIMNTLDDMISNNVPDRKKLTYSLATLLQIMIVETKDGEKYILGDRIGNEFMSFYNNSIAESADPQKLIPIAQKTAGLCGSEKYWETPYDELIKNSPQKLADIFTERFDVPFKTYCRFPQERMLAVAFALQDAINQIVSQNALDKETAASIVAEYGWRTSHYWNK